MTKSNLKFWFHAAGEGTDAEYELRDNGIFTGIGIQVSMGLYSINEYEFDVGGLVSSVKMHSRAYRSIAAAKEAALTLFNGRS